MPSMSICFAPTTHNVCAPHSGHANNSYLQVGKRTKHFLRMNEQNNSSQNKRIYDISSTNLNKKNLQEKELHSVLLSMW